MLLSEKIRGLLTPKKGSPVTSETAEAALEEARAGVVAAQAHVRELEAEHPDVLLSGDDAALERHEATLADARREEERLRLLVPRLEAKVQELEAAEAEAALDTTIRAAQKERSRGLELLRAYDAQARALAELLSELEEIDGGLDAAVEAARKAGRGDEISALPFLHVLFRGVSLPSAPTAPHHDGRPILWESRRAALR